MSATGPLQGVRVLELGTLIAGPFAGRLLGDMGADVIKIEAPGAPDPLRTWGQAELDGHRFFWTVHARNKKAVTLDLRRPQGRELFLELVEKSDIVVENFRPGTLEKWDLGYDVLLVPDHLGTVAPFPALVAAAQATSRPRVGTFVLNAGFWNPVLLAREAATVDALTDGRLELGLGTGYVRDAHERFQRMQERVHDAQKAPSEVVIDRHREMFGREYRLQTDGEHPVESLREARVKS